MRTITAVVRTAGSDGLTWNRKRLASRPIPGHSDVMTWADLDEYGKFKRDFLVAWVTAAMKSGKTAEAAAAEYTIPAAYKGYTANADQTKSNVAVIDKELAK